MGRRGFSLGGGSRKTSKREVSRFRQKAHKPGVMTPGLARTIFRAQALYDASDWDACEIEVRKLLKRRDFRQPLTYDALACCAQFQGNIDRAVRYYEKALADDPSYVDGYNRIVMILDAQATTTAERAQQLRRSWWKRYGAELYATRQSHLNDRDPERPLRVGYMSGDFHYHSAMTVVKQIATRHSEQVQAFLYSSTPRNKYDQTTTAYLAMPGWRDVYQWPTRLVADKIRTDHIDILVDLSNFTSCSRLPVFACRPAPIQVIGWGYALSTGFPCFDGVVSDPIVGTDHPETEPAICVPSTIDYEPLQNLPDPTPLPCLTHRPTFGVFQRSLKLNAENMAVYREILRRLPDARLIFKSLYSQKCQDWIRSHFGDQNAQVEIRTATSSVEHKTQYGEVDLSLDTWPQGGGVSACDAFHMGVPCVTLTGPRAIQRIGASLLTNMQLPQFIAHSHEEYIQKAIYFVTEGKQELAALRPVLRQRLAESPICAGYLEKTEAMYRDLWRAWCARPLSLEDAMARLRSVS